MLGSNGAGKTTLLRTLSSTLRLHRGRVQGGEVLFRGKSLKGMDPAKCVAAGLVQVPEGRRIFSRLTVEENFRAGGLSSKNRDGVAKAHSRVHELFPVLAERRSQRAGLLSGGEQQMLAIGRGLMAQPSLLLLDEPSLGLAPKIIGQIGEVVREIHRQGISVLLVEQNATMALNVADHAFVLDVGEVSLSGPADELAQTGEVQRLYLGHGDEDARPAKAHDQDPVAVVGVTASPADVAVPDVAGARGRRRDRQVRSAQCLERGFVHRRTRDHPRCHRSERCRQVDDAERPVRGLPRNLRRGALR